MVQTNFSKTKPEFDTIAQSICTHYSNLSGRPDIFLGSGTLKKIRSTKKQGAKKQGHCFSKREEEGWPLLFLNNNDPVFCTLLFLDLIFFRVTNRPMFSKQEYWVQIDWANVLNLYFFINYQSNDKIRWTECFYGCLSLHIPSYFCQGSSKLEINTKYEFLKKLHSNNGLTSLILTDA